MKEQRKGVVTRNSKHTKNLQSYSGSSGSFDEASHSLVHTLEIVGVMTLKFYRPNDIRIPLDNVRESCKEAVQRECPCGREICVNVIHQDSIGDEDDFVFQGTETYRLLRHHLLQGQ